MRNPIQILAGFASRCFLWLYHNMHPNERIRNFFTLSNAFTTDNLCLGEILRHLGHFAMGVNSEPPPLPQQWTQNLVCNFHFVRFVRFFMFLDFWGFLWRTPFQVALGFWTRPDNIMNDVHRLKWRHNTDWAGHETGNWKWQFALAKRHGNRTSRPRERVYVRITCVFHYLLCPLNCLCSQNHITAVLWLRVKTPAPDTVILLTLKWKTFLWNQKKCKKNVTKKQKKTIVQKFFLFVLFFFVCLFVFFFFFFFFLSKTFLPWLTLKTGKRLTV